MVQYGLYGNHALWYTQYYSLYFNWYQCIYIWMIIYVHINIGHITHWFPEVTYEWISVAGIWKWMHPLILVLLTFSGKLENRSAFRIIFHHWNVASCCNSLPHKTRTTTSWSHKEPGPWFNIKMTSYQYRKSHCGDKTILRPSYLHNGISYTGKMTSFYWISPQVFNNHSINLFHLGNR